MRNPARAKSSPFLTRGAGATRAVATRAVGDRLRTVLKFLPRAALQYRESREYVHDVRVAARRATAAIELFRGYFAGMECDWFLRQLKRIRHAAGAARDLDVFLDRLERQPPTRRVAVVAQLANRNRLAAQEEIASVFRRLVQHDAFAERMTKMLAGSHTHRADDTEKFHPWARDQLKPVVQKFFKAAPNRGAGRKDLHRFRIKGKRLRYAMELLAPAFPPSLRWKLYPVVERIQSLLGTLNDHAAFTRYLQENRPKARRNGEGKRIRKLIEHERDAYKAAKHEFVAYWFKHRHKLRRGLRRCFEQARSR